MKATAVQSLRSIVSKLHPPVALSQKESQRLLNALTSSFRQQLDQEHLAVQSTPSRASPHHVSRPQSQIPGRQTYQSSAEQHLASVLTNPLLARSSESDGPGTRVAGESTSALRHPMQTFENHVAHGTATLEVARLCLGMFRNTVRGCEPGQRQSAIVDARPGARILTWLISSGQATKDVFTHDMSFVKQVTEYLIAEGREEAIWKWMTTLDSEIMIEVPGQARTIPACPQALLLKAMVMAQINVDSEEGFKAALTSFLRAVDSEYAISPSISRLSFLRPAGMFLGRKLVHPSAPSRVPSTYATLFDRFVWSCALWDKVITGSVTYWTATLNLHHPLRTNAADALEYIRHLSRRPDHITPSNTKLARSYLLQMALDTARVLQAQRLDDDAAWVMEFVQQRFRDELVNAVDATRQSPSVMTKASDGSSEDALGASALLNWRFVPG